MKTTVIKYFFLLALISLTACELENAPVRPDYTLTGKQMYDKTDNHVGMLTDWIGILFKMNTYIQAPIANKNAVEDKYFVQYKVRNASPSTWVLLQNGDTIYTVTVDGNAFTTAGAKWKIKTPEMTVPCQFSCVKASNWLVNVSNFATNKISNYDYSYPYSTYTSNSYITDSINFSSDVVAPENYTSYNFQLSGKGEFLLNSASQKVKITFSTTQTLKHDANSLLNTNSGKYSLSALDLGTAETAKATALFETLSVGNSKQITIDYNSKTQTYINDQTNYYPPVAY